MSEWQPIATAPKDGTPLLLCDSKASPPFMVIGFWGAGERSYDTRETWRACWDYGRIGTAIVTLSHWMPVPEPPA